MRPAEHLIGDGLDDFYANTLRPKIDRLDEIMDPSLADEMAYRHARTTEAERHRFGPPNAGGRKDQPAWWLFVVEATETARERAEALNRREEAAAGKVKAEQMPDPGQT